MTNGFSGLKLVAVVAVAMLATACGGGGGDNKQTDLPTTNPPPTGTNAPPTISGTPASSVVVGQAYTFQPAATDPNSDTLTFSATGLPSWASINTGTGRVTGTPSAAGTSGAIVIMVSDGKGGTAALAGFTITVNAMPAPATGNATLSWTPPTQNTDGSNLSDLAGYRILYGRSAGNLDQQIANVSSGLTAYTVEGLSTGATWYFAIVAVNGSGAASQPSNVASKSI